MKRYIGIDPGGTTGSIASIDIENEIVGINIWTMEKMTPKDIWDVCCELKYSGSPVVVRALIEKVASMPGDAASAALSFGINIGQCQMALIAAGIENEPILPQKWQKEFVGLSSGKQRFTDADLQELKANWSGPALEAAIREKKKSIKTINGRIKTEMKNKRKEYAQRLFPQLRVTLNNMDSLLIAYYAFKHS